ncbi:MAG: heterodisulfide reductase-related iron-sulfur binding cluster [Brooklawnia sp.]|jgi:D-lactate dehydrogenase
MSDIIRYQYTAIETCAVDSSCAANCPYGIDTGVVMKQFRNEQANPTRERIALAVARQWGFVERAARLLMVFVGGVQRVFGHRPFEVVTGALRKVVSPDLLPTVPGPMPKAAKARLPHTLPDGAAAVYFPACVNRIFGRDPDAPADALSLPEALVKVSARAGRQLWIPPDVGGHCCGTIWSSKGYAQGRDHMYLKMANSLLDWTGEGELPVVVDATSCTAGLLREVPKKLPVELRTRYEQIRIVDSLTWAHDLLDDLTIAQPADQVVLHPGCSANKLGLDRTSLALARAVARDVHVPYGAGCCGTAGDRGLLHPELVVSATKDERMDLPDGAAVYLSSNRTCEMGLRQVTGQPFESVVYMLEEASRPQRGKERP